MAITPGVILPLIGPVPTPGPSTAVVPPSIISVTPSSAYPGDIIVITGTNLTGTTVILFGNQLDQTATHLIPLAEEDLFAVNGPNQITFAVPNTGGLPTSFLQIQGTYPGGALASFNILIEVTWDAIGCRNLARDNTFTACPSVPNFLSMNNVSVGVQIDQSHLTAQSYSGQSGQGACVSPLYTKSSGLIYWEITWMALSDKTLVSGIGVCDISAIPNWAAMVTGVGGAILRPDGSVWVNNVNQGTSFASGLAQGDTIGLLLNFANGGQSGVVSLTMLGVKGSVKNIIGGIIIGSIPVSNYVPCVVFDTASISASLAVTALFSQRNQGAFVGPSVFPNILDGTFTYGWPGKAS